MSRNQEKLLREKYRNRLVDLSKTWPIDEPAFESKSQLLSVTYITIVAKFVIDP